MNLHSIIISSTLLCPKVRIQCLRLLPRSPLPSPCPRTTLQNLQTSKRAKRYNRRLLCFEQKEEGLQSTEELQPVSSSEKKGTVAGAMAFIIGTSIGSGILAIPEKASPAVTFFFSSNISQL
ncbi:tyrosine-specific transport protein 1-like isoform X3 [Cucumis melo var. makuwa]|uniref:Tyrosine-specific transport protein 1-like isoform X3 n=1 Tax=Cucumis melo var. makuwa TaxID=1194695 RepID=A0A5D3BLN3_CUCMM|nr:tyrosine-specific transport protein 1-like isoform X3 [Cucumis melo var. makuwa]